MADIDLRDLVAEAVRLQLDWEARDIEFCFIGGLAVQHWGEPRLTNDVDATVWTEFGHERPVIERLLKNLSPRINDAVGFAVANRVLLVQSSLGIDIDISLAAFPFEKELIKRSQNRSIGGSSVNICDASDLIILKAFANRPGDWQDIRGILIRSESEIDWPRINAELSVLANLKEETEILTQLEQLRDQLYKS